MLGDLKSGDANVRSPSHSSSCFVSFFIKGAGAWGDNSKMAETDCP